MATYVLPEGLALAPRERVYACPCCRRLFAGPPDAMTASVRTRSFCMHTPDERVLVERPKEF